MFFAPSKSRWGAKIQSIGVSKTSDHIKIKIYIPNLIQEPPAYSKCPTKDFKDMDVLFISQEPPASLGHKENGCSADLKLKIASKKL